MGGFSQTVRFLNFPFLKFTIPNAQFLIIAKVNYCFPTMTKKAFVLASSILLLVILLGLFRFIRLPIVPVHPHGAIPGHTALFFSTKKDDLEKLLKGAPPLADLFLPKNTKSDYSLFLEITEGVLELPAEQAIYVSVNPSNSLGLDLLFIMPNARGAKPARFGEKAGWQPRKSIFDNQEVFTFRKDDQEFSFAKYRNLLVFARHAYLVENAVSQLKKPSTSICSEKAFRSTYRQLDADESSFPIFINLQNLSSQFAPLLNASKFSQLKKISGFGKWLQLQVPLDGQPTKWKGAFVPAENHVLSKVSKASNTPFSDNILQALPDNLSAIMLMTVKGLQKESPSEDWATHINSWAGNELALAIGEPLDNDRSERFFLLQAKDGAAAESALSKWSGQEAQEYQVFKTWQLDGADFDEIIGAEVHFATSLGDYVLFGNNLQGMERWLGKYLAGQTFSKSVDFLQLKSALPPSSDILLYMDGIKGWQLISPFFNEQALHSLNRNPLPFDAVMASLTWDGRVGEMEFVIPGSGETQANHSANILWSVPLLANAAKKPFVGVDPQTGEMDIFAVDSDNRIYLISRSGQVLWRRQLSEPILSNIFQTDIGNDGQWQFVFSTRSAIYAVDRKGGDVDGFPLELQVPASNGVTVVDFFQSHDYHFFIACENGKAYGFDEKGSPIEGWRPNENVGDIRYPLLHFQAQGKDFLALLESNGNMQVYKKNGSFRFANVDFGSPDLQPLDYQVSRSSSRIVTANRKGKVFVTNLSGDHFALQLKAGNNEDVKFLFSDIMGDERKDYIALSGKDLSAYYYGKKKFGQAFTHQFPWAQDEIFSVKWARRKKEFIGTVNRGKKQVFLMDGTGRIPDQFPLAGSTPFVMVDLAGDGKPVVITGNGAEVTAYVIE